MSKPQPGKSSFVWVGLWLPKPDFPQRREPVEIHVFESEDAARAWAQDSPGQEYTDKRLYRREVKAR